MPGRSRTTGTFPGPNPGSGLDPSSGLSLSRDYRPHSLTPMCVRVFQSFSLPNLY